VLVAVNMLNMGFDGNVETVIVAKSVNIDTAIQIRGRALRRDASQPRKKALFVAPEELFEGGELTPPGQVVDDVEPLLPSLSPVMMGFSGTLPRFVMPSQQEDRLAW